MSKHNQALKAVDAGSRAEEVSAELAAILDADPGLSQESVARQIGRSGGTVSRFVNGKLTGDVAAVTRLVESWIRAYRQRTETQMPKAPEFVETPLSARIERTLEYAQLSSGLAVICGAAGACKTKTIVRYCATRPRAWYITSSPSTKRVVPTLEEVALALGITVANGAARLRRAILEKMRGTNGLLIVDDAQSLSVEALDELRTIRDLSGCGLVLAGNETVYSSLTGGTRAPYLDRLYSRVSKVLMVEQPGAGDVDALVAGWAVKIDGCRKLLHDIAAKDGGLRSVSNTLALAALWAAGESRPVSCDDIRSAWAELGVSS